VEKRFSSLVAGGYLGSVLVGDVIAGLGVKNGWAGVIVYGAVRDSRALEQIDLGIKALSTSPRKGYKNAAGQTDIIILFGGVSFILGNRVYSNDDGILVSGENLM
jgi:regulator of ribonuclease activity A